MGLLKFVLPFALLFAVFAGVPTGHAGLAFLSSAVVGVLAYGLLRWISIPFRR